MVLLYMFEYLFKLYVKEQNVLYIVHNVALRKQLLEREISQDYIYF